MKTSLCLAAVLFAAAASASGAEMHGTVSENGKPLPQGVALKLECGGQSAEAKTDEFGSYSLKVAGAGECRVSIEYKGSAASLKVALYDKPSRYDLVVKEEAGKLSLARK